MSNLILSAHLDWIAFFQATSTPHVMREPAKRTKLKLLMMKVGTTRYLLAKRAMMQATMKKVTRKKALRKKQCGLLPTEVSNKQPRSRIPQDNPCLCQVTLCMQCSLKQQQNIGPASLSHGQSSCLEMAL